MSGESNRQQPEYSLRDLLDLVKKEVMLSLNCHAIASIVSFDASKQTVQAQLSYKQAYEQRDARTGKYGTILVDYPVLVDCPAIILGGGGGALTFPIKAGDECVILFNDRDIDNWFAGAPNGDLASSRLHSMSDGLALIGVRSLGNALEGYSTTHSKLFGPGGAEIKLNEKIGLSNETQSLKEVLEELVDLVKDLADQTAALTVTGVQSGGSASGIPTNAFDITLISANLAQNAVKLGELLE